MKLVITGGHLSPALCIIDELENNTEVLFIGRKFAHEGDTHESLEYKEITKRAIPFRSITTGRLQRRLTRHTVPSLVKFPFGTAQALDILRSFRPDAVLLFGGYLSVPVAIAATILRIPIVIHEQTLECGFANKIIAPMAARICVSWESSLQFFPKEKTVVTGNPLRKFPISINQLSDNFPIPNEKSLPVLFITGGSTGAHAINELVRGALEELLMHFIVIHQTGDNLFHDFEHLEEKKTALSKELKERYIVTKFVSPDKIGALFMQADLVLSRSGINTVTELLSLKKPALLIPLPYGQKNEQLKNAIFLRDAGLAQVVTQHGLTPEVLVEKLVTQYRQRDNYRIRKEFSSTIKTDAAMRIMQVVNDVAKKTNSQTP